MTDTGIRHPFETPPAEGAAQHVAVLGPVTRDVVFAGLRAALGHQARAQFNDQLLRTTPDKAASVILRGVLKDNRRILIGADACEQRGNALHH